MGQGNVQLKQELVSLLDQAAWARSDSNERYPPQLPFEPLVFRNPLLIRTMGDIAKTNKQESEHPST